MHAPSRHALSVFTLFTVSILALTGCSNKKGNDMFTVNGSLSLEERPTIEAFQHNVEPAIHRLIEVLATETHSAIEYDGFSSLERCDNTEGWFLTGQMLVTGSTTGDKLLSFARVHLEDVGFIAVTNTSGDGNLSYTWGNPDTGGFVSSTVSDGSTRVHYASGCLPSDGSTTQAQQYVPTRREDGPQSYDPSHWKN